jgi:hypothetical protein
MSITMKAWFRGIAAAFKSEASAQTFAGISILALSIYTGKPFMTRDVILDEFIFISQAILFRNLR